MSRGNKAGEIKIREKNNQLYYFSKDRELGMKCDEVIYIISVQGKEKDTYRLAFICEIDSSLTHIVAPLRMNFNL